MLSTWASFPDFLGQSHWTSGSASSFQSIPTSGPLHLLDCFYQFSCLWSQGRRAVVGQCAWAGWSQGERKGRAQPAAAAGGAGLEGRTGENRYPGCARRSRTQEIRILSTHPGAPSVKTHNIDPHLRVPAHSGTDGVLLQAPAAHKNTGLGTLEVKGGTERTAPARARSETSCPSCFVLSGVEAPAGPALPQDPQGGASVGVSGLPLPPASSRKSPSAWRGSGMLRTATTLRRRSRPGGRAANSTPAPEDGTGEPGPLGWFLAHFTDWEAEGRGHSRQEVRNLGAHRWVWGCTAWVAE